MPKSNTKTTTPEPQEASARFDISIPQAEIEQAYRAVIKSVQANTQIKGFRKGKAPLDVVEQSADKSKMYEQVFEQLFPEKYKDAVVERKLHPVASPKVTVKEAKAEGDWVFDVEVALRPVIDLGQYQDEIKAASATNKIWTPGKGKDGKTPEPTRDQKLNQIFDVLLKTVKINISPLLVEDETNRTLSQLLDQVNTLGLTLEQYVSSLNKTVEQLKKEQHQNADANLKIEYILAKIAEVENLNVTDKEYEDFLQTVKDADTLAKLKSDSNAQANIRYTLSKRKVIDFLLKLID
jgi:FKBP-type peptidyl-prolyl cis-trans isomerase (trigger factor)